MILAGHSEESPVRPVAPVSAFKPIAGLADKGARYENKYQDEVLEREHTPTSTLAVILGPVEHTFTSSPFLAQHIAQENFGENRPSKSDDEASLDAYRAAAERGTFFLGLEIPVDLTV